MVAMDSPPCCCLDFAYHLLRRKDSAAEAGAGATFGFSLDEADVGSEQVA
jgi:hypothetical protein